LGHRVSFILDTDRLNAGMQLVVELGLVDILAFFSYPVSNDETENEHQQPN
jgi:hypothetical protein